MTRRAPAVDPGSDIPVHPKLQSDMRRSPSPHRLRRRVRRSVSAGKRSAPTTPLLKWDAVRDNVARKPPTSSNQQRAGAADLFVRPASRKPAHPRISVRKLAAAIWYMQKPEVARGNGVGGHALVGFEHIPRHLQGRFLKQHKGSCNNGQKSETSSPNSVLDAKNGCFLHDFQKVNGALLRSSLAEKESNDSHHHDFHKVQIGASSGAFLFSEMERATKWDPEGSKAYDNALLLATELNLLNDDGNEKAIAISLHLQLQHARERISKLEAERHSAKKYLDEYLKKLAEEKVAWRSREHDKMRSIIGGMKADLDRERRTRKRLEMINSKLVDELKETRSSMKHLLQDLDKERKGRELVEEVCDELAKEVEEDRVNIEALKQQLAKMREEVDEERKMLQMAEVWREERVQMKLVDAKLTLQAQYSQLDKLQQDVKAFLEAHGHTKPDSEVLREVDQMMQLIDTVKCGEIQEFNYEPPTASEDIYSIIAELHAHDEQTEASKLDCCERIRNSSVIIDEPEIIEGSPGTELFLEKQPKSYANGDDQYNGSETEDISSWETTSHEEMQGSVVSYEGNNPLAIKGFRESEDSNTETKQQRKRESAIFRLWKSARPKNCEIGRREEDELAEIANGRPSDGRSVSTEYRSENGNQDHGTSLPMVLDPMSSPDSINIHLHRSSGFRGCIDCPRAVQKNSLKAKLLEARLQSQKIQLRHVLEQKMQ